MSYYESVFVARQDITVAQADALSADFCKIIEDHGGKIAGVERWGLRSLAYKIKKNRKGHYLLINIDASGEAIHEMERQMRLNEDVLRYMTIRVDTLDKAPSPLAQVATERNANAVGEVKTKAVEETKPKAVEETKPKAVEETKSQESVDPVKAKDDKPAKAEESGSDAAEGTVAEAADDTAAEAADDTAAEDIKGDDK